MPTTPVRISCHQSVVINNAHCRQHCRLAAWVIRLSLIVNWRFAWLPNAHGPHWSAVIGRCLSFDHVRGRSPTTLMVVVWVVVLVTHTSLFVANACPLLVATPVTPLFAHHAYQLALGRLVARLPLSYWSSGLSYEHQLTTAPYATLNH